MQGDTRQRAPSTTFTRSQLPSQRVQVPQSDAIALRIPETQTQPPIADPRPSQTPAEHVITSPTPTALPPSEPIPQAFWDPERPTFKPYLIEPEPSALPSRVPVDLISSVPPPATSDTVRVALLLPLSGLHGQLGQAMLNAAQLALFDFADSRFELLLHDTHGTAEGAMTAAALAIGDGAAVVLGPLLSGSVQAVSPLARAAHVPVIGFSNDRSVAGQDVYTMGFLPRAQVERVVTYAYSRGITRFAALVPDNVYGSTTVSVLEETTTRLGAIVTRVKYYDPSAQDFADTVRVLANYDERRQALLDQRKDLEERDDELAKQALKRLEKLQTIGELTFEALLLPDGGKRLLSVAALLPFYDIDPNKVRMLGTGQWDGSELKAEPALIGGWYAAPPPAARGEFEKKFRNTYGEQPPRLVTLAYDAIALAAVLARNESGPDFSAAAITNPNGFWGRDGIFRFVPTGVAERGLAIMQLGPKSSRVLSPAPEAFQTALSN